MFMRQTMCHTELQSQGSNKSLQITTKLLQS